MGAASRAGPYRRRRQIYAASAGRSASKRPKPGTRSVLLNTRSAAQNWARTWQQAWEHLDVEAVLTLYAPEIEYWTEPFREPYRGLAGAREYATGSFGSEHTVTAWFGEPVVDGDRAAIPWWGTMVEEGNPTTLAGISLLRFNADGLVAEQWDGWNQADKMRPRPPGWAET